MVHNEVNGFRTLVSGSTGLVGTPLVEQLRSDGCDVTRLVRSQPQGDERAIVWSPDEQRIDPSQLEGLHAVVHLAGENIAGRWTEKKKRAIRESRMKGTRTLAEAVATLAVKPKVFICASAVGYYGDRGDEVLDESAGHGDGFLAQVCVAWEAACEPARQAGIRVANLRFGIVLSPDGGALGKMLTPFKMGVAGVIGSGDQWWSWVALEDVISIIEKVLTDESLSGPVNVAAPNPATNREFTKALGHVLNRPTIATMPAFAAKMAFGREMAEETMLASAKVVPRKLLDSDYEFQYPEIEGALRAMFAEKASV